MSYTLPKLYPQTTALYPHSPKSLCVLEGGGGRHALVQAIQSGFSTGYLAVQRFRICVPINEGGS